MKIIIVGIIALALGVSASATTATYTDTSHPSISPNMIKGDSFTLVVTGAPNSTVTAVSAAGQFTVGTTDSNGVWQVLNGAATSMGTYTVTYSVAGVAAPANTFTIYNPPTATYTDMSHPSLSPNMINGDSFKLVVTGPANATVTAASAGGQFTVGTTDSNGVWQVLNGTATSVGTYTVTYSVAGIAAPADTFTIYSSTPALSKEYIYLNGQAIAIENPR